MCERKVGETTTVLNILWLLHLAWPPCTRALRINREKEQLSVQVSPALEQQQGQQGTTEMAAGVGRGICGVRAV